MSPAPVPQPSTRKFLKPGILFLILFLITFIQVRLPAQTPDGTVFTSRSDPWPGLRWLDASLLVRTLQEQPGLLMARADGSKTIVWAKKVSLHRRLIPGQEFPGRDGPWHLIYGPFDPSRWDVLINGEAIDPRQFFILWDGMETNLGMLFTFREELPASGSRLDSYPPAWTSDSP